MALRLGMDVRAWPPEKEKAKTLEEMLGQFRSKWYFDRGFAKGIERGGSETDGPYFHAGGDVRFRPKADIRTAYVFRRHHCDRSGLV